MSDECFGRLLFGHKEMEMTENVQGVLAEKFRKCF
jgi:hypothetical protein